MTNIYYKIPALWVHISKKALGVNTCQSARVLPFCQTKGKIESDPKVSLLQPLKYSGQNKKNCQKLKKKKIFFYLQVFPPSYNTVIYDFFI